MEIKKKKKKNISWLNMCAFKLNGQFQKWDKAIAIWCSKMFHALLSFTGLSRAGHAFLYSLKIEAASYLLEARLRLSAVTC